jgi:hypothetical protein
MAYYRAVCVYTAVSFNLKPSCEPWPVRLWLGEVVDWSPRVRASWEGVPSELLSGSNSTAALPTATPAVIRRVTPYRRSWREVAAYW